MKEIGNLLKEARESRGVTIDDISKELRIRSQYIEAMESGNISSFSKDVYLIGYLNSYSHWLGLNSSEIIRRFKSESGKAVFNKNISEELPKLELSFFSSVGAFSVVRLIHQKMTIVFSLAILVLLFLFWSRNYSDNVFDRHIVDIENINKKPYKYAGFAYKSSKYKKIMLLAKSDVNLKLYYDSDNVVERMLDAGDAYFLEDGRDVLISSNSPKDIDIYSDDVKQKFFGTLEDFYILN